jgi:hypothetical protein
MHLCDDIARQGSVNTDIGPHGEWPPDISQTPNVTLRYSKEAADSTNESLLELNLIQPEDL